jgi:hypothetical protein
MSSACLGCNTCDINAQQLCHIKSMVLYSHLHVLCTNVASDFIEECAVTARPAVSHAASPSQAQALDNMNISLQAFLLLCNLFMVSGFSYTLTYTLNSYLGQT